MAIKLKDIEGLMILKSDCGTNTVNNPCESCNAFNDAIEKQGQKRIEKVWDREKLAQMIYELQWPSSKWCNQGFMVCERFRAKADAIISADQKDNIVQIKAVD